MLRKAVPSLLTVWFALFYVLTQAGGEVLPKPSYENTFYLMPGYIHYVRQDREAAAKDAEYLKEAFGEGPYARAGFWLEFYSFINDWPADEKTAEEKLRDRLQIIDETVARARKDGIPVGFSFMRIITPPPWLRKEIRGTEKIKMEDRRVCQWFMDNALMADKFWAKDYPWEYAGFSPSRYSRKFRDHIAISYKVLAGRIARYMHLYPETMVMASGEKEVVLSTYRAGMPYPYADYNPFAVAEFRDWLRHAGMYADNGGQYAGEGYNKTGIDYFGDKTPATDDNGDGHTLNGDYGTNFTAWRLKYFDWDLADDFKNDPKRIPYSAYGKPDWNPMPQSGPDYIEGGFDAPREENQSAPFWQVWWYFRQCLINHYNKDVARMVTTAVDPVTNASIPRDRWFTHQIPSEFLSGVFLGVPGDLTEKQHLATSASPAWTANIAPYGSPGYTGYMKTLREEFYAYVVKNVSTHWAMTEYHPAVGMNPDLSFFNEQLGTIWKYRPHFIVPWYWGDGNLPGSEWVKTFRVKGVNFEKALRKFMDSIRNRPRTQMPGVSYTPPKVHGLTVERKENGALVKWSPLIWDDVAGFEWKQWPDFDHFNVYAGRDKDFEPVPGALAGSTQEYGFVDGNSSAGQFYRVSSVNSQGEEGEASAAAGAP